MVIIGLVTFLSGAGILEGLLNWSELKILVSTMIFCSGIYILALLWAKEKQAIDAAPHEDDVMED